MSIWSKRSRWSTMSDIRPSAMLAKKLSTLPCANTVIFLTTTCMPCASWRTSSCVPPLEAQLIDVADEIAYSTADLDDGYESRLLTLEQIRNGVRVFERFYCEV